jgi:hypothetical protein
MKLLSRFFVLAITLFWLTSSCAPEANFDLRGAWEYTMIATTGNTYDTGTITFSGQPTKGTYLETNIYQVEYKGDFTVNGTDLKLTGDETWQGALADANTIKGAWSHNDGVSGTFTAKRK